MSTGRALKRSEKDENADVASFAKSLGMVPDSTQQFRPSKQAEGLADFWIFDPIAHGAFWWEGKEQHGVQSLKQQRFQTLCDQCGIPYGIGTFADFLTFCSYWRRKTMPPPPLDCHPWQRTRAVR